MIVADALRRHQIRAVLTGGACAAVYSRGLVKSRDADFVLVGRATQAQLDDAMRTVGFKRRNDRYVHPSTGFFVEFPKGPLAIGEDAAIRPVVWRDGARRGLALSATDSCRDRLAAFYHWKDHSSLKAAVQIATTHRVAMKVIERWSEAEDAARDFATFAQRLREARATLRRRRATTGR